jgi:hypothetical protein
MELVAFGIALLVVALVAGIVRSTLRARAIPPRTNDVVFRRMIACHLSAERAHAEIGVREGKLSPEQGKEIAALLYAAAFGTGMLEHMDEIERHVFDSAVAALPEKPLMIVHWRSECAVALGWALGLLDSLPPPAERGQFPWPESRQAFAAFRARARLREAATLDAKLGEWAELRRATARALEQTDDEAHRLEDSRALERYRALLWLRTRSRDLDSTPFTPP